MRASSSEFEKCERAQASVYRRPSPLDRVFIANTSSACVVCARTNIIAPHSPVFIDSDVGKIRDNLKAMK